MNHKNSPSTAIALTTIAIAMNLMAYVVEDSGESVVLYYTLIEQSHGWFQSLGSFEHPKDSVMNIEVSSALDIMHDRNYPRPSNLCKGINDTLILQIKFMSQSYSNLGWEKDPELWIAPTLFNIYSNIVTDAPAIDSTELQYATRRWIWRGRTMSPAPPDSFPARKYEFTLDINVWGFPEGQWVLCAGKTDNAPEDANLLESGMEFIYYTAKDGQDSVNAFIGCAERAMQDNDVSTAIAWTDTALTYYPKSVPAWWERGNLYFSSGDSLKCVQSIDSALYFLDGFRDPLLPDTTKEIAPFERQFVRYIAKRISEDRLCSYAGG